MKKSKPLYTITNLLASVLMLVLLSWLTVCLPIVNQSNKAAKAQMERLNDDTQNDNSNPLTNTNEEKTESGNSMLSEYLHDVTVVEHHFTLVKSYFKGHSSALYIAFHPDLFIPPPEA